MIPARFVSIIAGSIGILDRATLPDIVIAGVTEESNRRVSAVTAANVRRVLERRAVR